MGTLNINFECQGQEWGEAWDIDPDRLDVITAAIHECVSRQTQEMGPAVRVMRISYVNHDAGRNYVEGACHG